METIGVYHDQKSFRKIDKKKVLKTFFININLHPLTQAIQQTLQKFLIIILPFSGVIMSDCPLIFFYDLSS